MGNKRDDFSKETIRIVRDRVNGLCSFPGCNVVTIGASMENNTSVSNIGVAAHICAAAKGGPRYDEKMTPEQRKSVDNCIWLCQGHAKLIDTDVKTYTVEKLHQWKKDAEKTASLALANDDYVIQYYKKNGENLSILKQLLDDMILTGAYDQFQLIVNQYKTPLSEAYTEFFLRHKIIYDVYCSRESLSSHLDDYLKLPVKTGKDELIRLFIAFLLVDEIKKLIEFCDCKSVKELATIVVSNKLSELFFKSHKKKVEIVVPEELSETISRLTINYLWNKGGAGNFSFLRKVDPMYDDEFFYKFINSIQEAGYYVGQRGKRFEEKTVSEHYYYIENNIRKIKLLDVQLQIGIWANLLELFQEDQKAFEFYLSLIPERIKKHNVIAKIILERNIKSGPAIDNVEEIISFCVSNNDYDALITYLSIRSASEICAFFDDYAFLLKKSISLINIRCKAAFGESANDQAVQFLSGYSDCFESSFLFHCLLARYLTEGEGLEKELEWIDSFSGEMLFSELMVYLQVLAQHKRWDKLTGYLDSALPNEYLFEIGVALLTSQEKKYYKIVRKTFQNLIDDQWERKGLYYYTGCIDENLGRIESAKRQYEKEFDNYQDLVSLRLLIKLRMESNDYLEDRYLESLKKVNDSVSQNLLGAVYLNLQNYNEAKKFFLRSLLIDDSSKESLNGLWHAMHNSPPRTVNQIKEDTVFVVASHNEKRTIAIHSADVMIGITPNEFANCKHYSINDISVSCLLFHKAFEEVEFEGDKWQIDKIMTADEFFSRFFFSSLQNREGVTTIRSTTLEELTSSLGIVLKQSKDELLETINEYNNDRMPFPISILATRVGKSMISTCEFLAYENTEPIKNNLQYIDEDILGYPVVLSFETIVYLAHLKVDLNKLSDCHFYCSEQVKNRLDHEIREECALLGRDDNATMLLEDEKPVYIKHTSEMRRRRFCFLNRLKALLNLLDSENEGDYTSDNPDLIEGIEALLSTKMFQTDSGTLALVKKLPQAILITDDQFVYSLAHEERIPNMGLCGLLVKMSKTWKNLILYSKQMQDLGFANYLPPFLYNTLIQKVSSIEEKSAESEILDWLRPVTDNKFTARHENIVLALFYSLFKKQTEWSLTIRLLWQVVVPIIEKNHPGTIDLMVLRICNLHNRMEQ